MTKGIGIEVVTAADVIGCLEDMRNDDYAQYVKRFFKTGEGGYGEGDLFLGLKVPQVRTVVKESRLRVSLAEIAKLLDSEWHEVRLSGFLLLVEEMTAALPKRNDDSPEKSARRKEIVDFYLGHAHRANNWDLVDLSAPYILGRWLLTPEADGGLPSSEILDTLASDRNLWRQRIAIVSTAMLIRNGRYDDTLRISGKLLKHPHDLIHKAVGWMLREVGKKDTDTLRDFLEEHHVLMSRTTLRYAIERLSPSERSYWLTRRQ